MEGKIGKSYPHFIFFYLQIISSFVTYSKSRTEKFGINVKFCGIFRSWMAYKVGFFSYLNTIIWKWMVALKSGDCTYNWRFLIPVTGVFFAIWVEVIIIIKKKTSIWHVRLRLYRLIQGVPLITEENGEYLWHATSLFICLFCWVGGGGGGVRGGLGVVFFL